MENFYFIINDDNTFELWINGECITDYYSLEEGEFDLMKDLVHFAKVPCYKKSDYKEIFDN